jgi:hypothetical protein
MTKSIIAETELMALEISQNCFSGEYAISIPRDSFTFARDRLGRKVVSPKISRIAKVERQALKLGKSHSRRLKGALVCQVQTILVRGVLARIQRHGKGED